MIHHVGNSLPGCREGGGNATKMIRLDGSRVRSIRHSSRSAHTSHKESTMIRTGGKVLAAVALSSLLLLAAAHAAGEDGFKELFNGKDLSGWKTVLSGKGAPDKTFKVEDGA